MMIERTTMILWSVERTAVSTLSRELYLRGLK